MLVAFPYVLINCAFTLNRFIVGPKSFEVNFCGFLQHLIGIQSFALIQTITYLSFGAQIRHITGVNFTYYCVVGAPSTVRRKRNNYPLTSVTESTEMDDSVEQLHFSTTCSDARS